MEEDEACSGVILTRVRDAFKKKVLFSLHALNVMNSTERMITRDEIHEVINNGMVMEDYPDDPRGHSCLIKGETLEGRNIFVVCSPKNSHLVIVTVYPEAEIREMTV